MKLLEYFDHVYVVNLPERTDRRKQTERELARIRPHRGFSKVTFMAATRPTDAGGFPSIGARGCYESHLRVLREARAAGHERILVLEDDFVCTPLLSHHEQELTGDLLANEWDLVWFGHDLTHEERTRPALMESSALFTQAHCYGVHGRCIDDLIGFLEQIMQREPGDPLGGPMHYDGALNTYRMQRNEQRRFLIALPSVADQRMSRSDIHPSLFDRFKPLRPFAAAARQVIHSARHTANELRYSVLALTRRV
jgi:glycosyl transferase family 25